MINAKLFPHLYSGCAFLVLRHVECAKVILEVLVQFGHQERKLLWFWHALFLGILYLCTQQVSWWRTTTVEECTLFAWVSMDINVHKNFLLFMKFLDHILEIVNLRMAWFIAMFPSAVQVVTCTWESIIPLYNTIGINHRHNFEQVFLFQTHCKFTIWNQFFQ